MKRNVLKKFRKTLKELNNHYGRYVFFIVGVIAATTMYLLFNDNKTSTASAEESFTTSVIYPMNLEESEDSQIGYTDKEIGISDKNYLGMSARIAHLDEPYVVQAIQNETVSTEEGAVLLLEKTVYAESRGEPEEGQIAVVNVILNRVEAPEEVYPNSVHEVVFDRRFNTIQFECAICAECKRNDTLCEICKSCNEIWAGDRIVTAEDITENLKDSVAKALSGENPIGDRTNFHRYNPEKCHHKDQIVIGKHVFY